MGWMMAIIGAGLPAISAEDWQANARVGNDSMAYLCQQWNLALGYAGSPLWHIGQRIDAAVSGGQVIWPVRKYMRKGVKFETGIRGAGEIDVDVKYMAYPGGVANVLCTFSLPAVEAYVSSTAVWEETAGEYLFWLEPFEAADPFALEGWGAWWGTGQDVDPTELGIATNARYIAEHEFADERALNVDVMSTLGYGPDQIMNGLHYNSVLHISVDDWERDMTPRTWGDTWIVYAFPFKATNGHIKVGVRNYEDIGGAVVDELVSVLIDQVEVGQIVLTSVGTQTQDADAGWDDLDTGYGADGIGGPKWSVISIVYRAPGTYGAEGSHIIQQVSVWEEPE